MAATERRINAVESVRALLSKFAICHAD